jgi:uncharacterized protein (TIGR02246 family)
MYFFAAMLIMAAGSTAAFAQTKTGSGSTSVDDQVMQMMKNFEDAYNRMDHQAVADLFTTNAERTDADGNTVSGAAQIGEVYKESFAKNKWKLMVRHESAARVEPGTVIGTGSWKVSGTDADGNPVTRTGTYSNEISIQDKQMRIRKMKVNRSL